MPWKFDTLPMNFWANPLNQRKFMNWLYNELKFQNQDDWYSLTTEVKLKLINGNGLLIKGINR